MSTYLSADAAAAELGVSLPTLYAYVSRGLIRSEREGPQRRRRYLAEDVWLLNERKRGRRAALGDAGARVAPLSHPRRAALLRRARRGGAGARPAHRGDRGLAVDGRS